MPVSLPAPATAATAATTGTASATLSLLRFIYAQGATAHVLAVQGLDGPLRIGTRHFHEPEATGTTGLAVVDQCDGLHRAMLLEQLTHLGLVRRKRQITYVDLCHDNINLSEKAPSAIAERTDPHYEAWLYTGSVPVTPVIADVGAIVEIPGLTFAVSSDFSEVGRCQKGLR